MITAGPSRLLSKADFHIAWNNHGMPQLGSLAAWQVLQFKTNETYLILAQCSLEMPGTSSNQKQDARLESLADLVLVSGTTNKRVSLDVSLDDAKRNATPTG